MYHCSHSRLAWMLAFLVTCGLTASGRGQQVDSAMPPSSGGYDMAADANNANPQLQGGVPAYQTSMAADAKGDPLADRVADLEKQLKAMKDKEAADKKKAAAAPSMQLSGMMQIDWMTFGQDAASKAQFGDVRDGCDFRRARLKASGMAFDVVDYSLEVDFGAFTGGWNSSTAGAPGFTTFTQYGPRVALKDTYIGLKELPVVGNFRIGHFKEPFGLDQLTSDRFSTFMERSLADENAFVPGRNMGAMIFNWTENERATWAAGVFRTDMVDYPPVRQTENGGTAFTARATWLPWYDEATEGRGLLHVGGAYSYRDIDELGVTFSAKPEAYLAPSVVSLTLPEPFANAYQLVGSELAFVYGPLSFQTEYFLNSVNERGTKPNGTLKGGYAYVSYFLTGESRPYNKKAGVFDRVKPFENFFRVRGEDGCVHTGKGAWEVAYRYSELNLNDLGAGLAGGYVHDHTFALNWYLNPYTRVMWDYVYSTDIPTKYVSGTAASTTAYGGTSTTAGAGKLSNMGILEMRIAIDF